MLAKKEADRAVTFIQNDNSSHADEFLGGPQDETSAESQMIHQITQTEMNGHTQEVDDQHSVNHLGSQRSNYTIPLATEKRVSREKVDDKCRKHSPNMSKVSLFASKRSSQPDNKPCRQEDACSVASSTASSVRRKLRATVPVAPSFRCVDRAEKRREYHIKLEEKHQALGVERQQAEARKKEEEDEVLKKLRKTLFIKANPVPSFYQDGAPPKVELKKAPPTRAKSPNLTRRKSCSDASRSRPHADTREVCSRMHRHSLQCHGPICAPKSTSARKGKE